MVRSVLVCKKRNSAACICIYLNVVVIFSTKEMLFRRTCKLVEFENATKALEKAKPKNQEAVSEQIVFVVVVFCLFVCNGTFFGNDVLLSQ